MKLSPLRFISMLHLVTTVLIQSFTLFLTKLPILIICLGYVPYSWGLCPLSASSCPKDSVSSLSLSLVTESLFWSDRPPCGALWELLSCFFLYCALFFSCYNMFELPWLYRWPANKALWELFCMPHQNPHSPGIFRRAYHAASTIPGDLSGSLSCSQFNTIRSLLAQSKFCKN